MNLGDRFGESNHAGTILDVRLTHQDLANMVASTREAVSKAMSEFRREGSIGIQDRKIVPVDKISPHRTRLRSLRARLHVLVWWSV